MVSNILLGHTFLTGNTLEQSLPLGLKVDFTATESSVTQTPETEQQLVPELVTVQA